MRSWPLLALLVLTSCRPRAELVVFHSEELSPLLGDLAEGLRRADPPLRLRLAPSDPLTAVRKVTELGQAPDLLAVTDAALLAPLVSPAATPVPFATDEVVLAHRDHSRFTDEITTANWPEVLAREGVRLGCASPETSEVGVHARLVWQLAGQDGLAARCQLGNTVAGSTELIAALESRAVDYVFVHRSTASRHHLKVTSLPPEWNLSRPELDPAYSRAAVHARGREHRGRALTCALLPLRNPEASRRLLDALASPAGQRALERAGFRPLPTPGSIGAR